MHIYIYIYEYIYIHKDYKKTEIYTLTFLASFFNINIFEIVYATRIPPRPNCRPEACNS